MLNYVQEKKEEYLDFLKKVLSFRSVPCEEKEVADAFLEELKKIDGVDEAFIDAAGNVVGVIRGEGTGPNVLLNGHMDVVPEGTLELWEPYDPFKPEIVDGKLIARGVADMKSGLVAQLYAFKAVAEYLKKTEKKLSGDLIFSGVVQEEPAEMFGMEELIEHTFPEKGLKCDIVYISEPAGDTVTIGQRGKIELVVKTFGKAVHSAAPQYGINALELMDPVLHAIFTHDGINLDPDPYLGATSITVTNCIVKPGGNLSTVPDECEIAVDRRFSTTLTEEDLLKEFEDIFEKVKKEYPEFKGSVEPRYFEETSYTGLTKKVKKWHPAWRVDRENEFVKKTFEALARVDQHPKEAYSQAGTDGSMSCAIHKIPTIIYSGIDGSMAHQPKEAVKVDELIGAFEGYIAILTELYDMDLSAF